MTIFKLNQMARLGDTAAVRVLLNSGITVDARDEQQYTPLMHAAGSLRAGIDMLQLLVQAGADVNATARSEVSLEEQTHVLVRSVIREALAGGQVEKIEYLLDTGADLHYTDPHGYEAMLHLVHGRDIRQDADLLPAARLLLSRGAAPNPVSTYGESPLRQAVSVGRFDLVQLLLEAGVTPQVSGWTDVVLVLLFDTMAALRPHLRVGADLDTADQLGLTPFHLTVLLGNVEKAALLVEAGADWTRPTDRGQSAAGLAIEAGRPEMLAWLLSRGGDPEAQDGLYRQNLVQIAITNRSPGCLEVLLAAGASPRPVNDYGQKAIEDTHDLASVRLLLAAGEDLQDAPLEMRHAFLGLDDMGVLDVSYADYEAGKRRRYGRRNPEQMADPFWEAMVRTRLSAWAARSAFDDRPPSANKPVWCNQRFGQTITVLRDSRFVEIGGEHEDWYDVDFCIYNEIIVYAEGAPPLIFGYPSSLFPPTDYHTATLVGDFIYIIGNLGYLEARKAGETPVYRLDTRTWRIERQDTTGNNPGWISRHEAVLVDEWKILVSGGKVWTADNRYLEQPGDFVLDLNRLTWHRV
jgi:ankyrin repeat protein